MKSYPTKIANWILRCFRSRSGHESLIGDFEEIYYFYYEKDGFFKAKIWYWKQVFKALPSFILTSLHWSMVMFLNYLKITLRNLKKQKIYSIINIGGLAAGLAIFILAAMYTDFGFSYDSFHKNANRIYCVSQINDEGSHFAWLPSPVAPMLSAEIPGIEKIVRYSRFGRKIMRYEDKKFYEDNIYYVDDSFFKIFTIKLISGNPETVLSTPNSVVIRESIAKKYFGEMDPVGRSIQMENGISLTVTGVSEDPPVNSILKYNFLISMKSAVWTDNWNSDSSTFILLSKTAAPDMFDRNFSSFVSKHFNGLSDRPVELYLYPLTELYLRPMYLNTWFIGMTPMLYYSIMAIAVIILLVVCINFMNLSTARYINRAKEVGMRKVIGAGRNQLIKQFLSESVLMSVIALPLAILLFELIKPAFIAAIGRNINLSIFNNPYMILYLFCAAVITGIVSGSYPAFFLSAFRPMQVLKNNIKSGKKGSRMRKTLVVTQFTMSVILIIFTIVVLKQFNFLKNADMGYNRENVIMLRVNSSFNREAEVLKNSLIQRQEILAAGSANWVPSVWRSYNKVIPKGKTVKEAITLNAYAVDYGFIETMELKIQKGRSFLREFNNDGCFIINETLAGLLDSKNPLGKQLTLWGSKGKVIGVAKDFHFAHSFTKMGPVLMYIAPKHNNYMYIKVSPDANMNSVLNYVKKQWNTLFPDVPFESDLLDKWIVEKFTSAGKVTGVFAAISIFGIILSCLGLLGLASYTVENKTKEISVRKVLGASVPGLVKSLTSEFLFLVGLSNVIAWPAAYFLSDMFLQSAWVYASDIKLSFFITAAALSLSAALLSVITQTVKAASANPVNALKYE